ncbi:uncharacterized protein LAJ45_01117 [Morchella importuna]|uniref:uncharacterized protein n=1 Tax=Morchella importuna TaxID=1174673 RepID=UPI001E8D1D4F|nr:uncharacterized protein LAJ45_01117 [Morchella importuna]KAH8154589.1 hypothetical protein LAJ45_01117 [Morchella importuna]
MPNVPPTGYTQCTVPLLTMQQVAHLTQGLLNRIPLICRYTTIFINTLHLNTAAQKTKDSSASPTTYTPLKKAYPTPTQHKNKNPNVRYPTPPYTRFAATPISPQDLAAAESELHRINKELESTADPEAYVESKKEVIDQCLSVACHHEHAAIIRRRGREEVLPTRYEWMCKYLQQRKDRMQEKIRRGVNGVVTGDLLRYVYYAR